MDKPCQRMVIELSGKNRDEGAKQAVGGFLRIAVQRSVQIKMQGYELVGTEAFAARVEGRKCLHVHQR